LPTERLETAENQMSLDRHSLHDSHPCLAARIRGLNRIQTKEITGEKPAARLFTDWPGLAFAMTQVLIRRGRFLHQAHMARLLGGR
jgi:hypothetical protein